MAGPESATALPAAAQDEATAAAAADVDPAELEVLADRIRAAAVAEGGHELRAAGASSAHAAGAAAASTLTVQECWEMAMDHNSGQQYWFNRATNTSQWHPPPGWAAAAVAAAAEAERPAAEAGFNPPMAGQEAEQIGQSVAATAVPAASPRSQPENQEQQGAAEGAGGAEQQSQQQPQWPLWPTHPTEPGFYYRDAFGLLQGPFTAEHLLLWRHMLPMDLAVLQLQAAGGEGAVSSISSNSGAAGAVASWKQHTLAGLLGDDELLERWRLENPEQAAYYPGSAPPAAYYEEERQKGYAHALAEAVLSGLPAHDNAVAVARMAAEAGKSIQEVVAWSHSVDYTATAYRVAARGRMQAEGGQESLYQEAASWMNPHDLEQQLAAGAERRKRALTGRELRQVKQRKQELKEKKRTAWLFT